MGEIDDKYAERLEVLENEFFEELKSGKNREETLERYHKKLKALVDSFENEYSKHLRNERREIGKKKAKPKKNGKFDNFEVSHLDFKMSNLEKTKINFSMLKFKTHRAYKKMMAHFMPSRLIYLKFRIELFFKRLSSFISDFFSKLVERTVYVVKRIGFIVFIGIKDLFKGIFRLLKSALSIFKRKKKEVKVEETKVEKVEEEKVGETS